MTLKEMIATYLEDAGEAASASQIQQKMAGSKRPIQDLKDALNELTKECTIRLVEPRSPVMRYRFNSGAHALATGNWRRNHKLYAQIEAEQRA